eukprot:scaffold635_cov311-Pinguiococcus_pyrenoidosus.AAC.5
MQLGNCSLSPSLSSSRAVQIGVFAVRDFWRSAPDFSHSPPVSSPPRRRRRAARRFERRLRAKTPGLDREPAPADRGDLGRAARAVRRALLRVRPSRDATPECRGVARVTMADSLAVACRNHRKRSR